jgi:hypothetical protein
MADDDGEAPKKRRRRRKQRGDIAPDAEAIPGEEAPARVRVPRSQSLHEAVAHAQTTYTYLQDLLQTPNADIALIEQTARQLAGDGGRIRRAIRLTLKELKVDDSDDAEEGTTPDPAAAFAELLYSPESPEGDNE